MDVKDNTNIWLEDYMQWNASNLYLMETGNPFALVGAGLNDLIKYADVTQIRIFCYKPVPGRTFHLKTDINYVVPKTKPKHCENVTKLKDDNAKMWETSCTSWYWKWSSGTAEQKIYLFVVFVYGKYHISLGAKNNGYRYECDDYVNSKQNTKGVWKYFVR